MSLFQDTGLVEWKNIDANFVDLVLPATNAFTGVALLNGVAQGAGTNQRIGRRATYHSLHYRFHLGLASGGSGAGQSVPVRILIVYDKQTNGGTPPNTEILQTPNFQGQMLLNQADRFVIVSDKVHEIDSSGPTTGKCYKKMKLETVYGGPGALSADITTGAFFLLIATSPIGGTTSVINLNVRMRYTDQ